MNLDLLPDLPWPRKWITKDEVLEWWPDNDERRPMISKKKAFKVYPKHPKGLCGPTCTCYQCSTINMPLLFMLLYLSSKKRNG